MDIFERLDSENEQQYIWRIGQAKENGELEPMTWFDIADVINEEFHADEPRNESVYRKAYSCAKEYYNNVFLKGESSEYLQDLKEQQRAIYRERTMLRDERNDINRKLRSEARLLNRIDELEKSIVECSGKHAIGEPVVVNDSGCDMFVALSDLHIGAMFDSFGGKYNVDIAKNRINEYLAKIALVQKLHNAKNCVVGLLGDLISGNIHKSISVSNQQNVVEQVATCAKLLTDFIYQLSLRFEHVFVHSVSGNHSRIERKDDAIKDERLDNFIPFYLKASLQNVSNVLVETENPDGTVATFSIRGHDYACVHGDYDDMSSNSISRLVMWLGFKPDGIICGHKHAPAFKDISGVEVYQSGSLSGSGDDFTCEKRLACKASQTILVIDDSGVDAVYNVHFSE